MTEKSPQFDLATLTDRLALDAQHLANLGVPLEAVAEAFVAVGLRFELAAHGPAVAAVRLAAATSAMTEIVKAIAASPPADAVRH